MIDLKTYAERANVAGIKSIPFRLYILQKFEEFLRKKRLKTDEKALVAWLEELRKEGYSKNTLHTYMHIVLSYFTLTFTELDEKTVKIIKNMYPTVLKPVEETLSPSEVRDIIATARLPFNIIFAIMYTYARRVSEVLALKWEDVDFTKKTITFTILKKKRDEFATFDLDPAIEEMLKENREMLGEDYIFERARVSVWREFNKVCRELKIDKNVTLHSLRDARVTHLRLSGVSLDFISKYLLRHSSYDITLTHYRAIAEEEIVKISKLDKIL